MLRRVRPVIVLLEHRLNEDYWKALTSIPGVAIRERTLACTDDAFGPAKQALADLGIAWQTCTEPTDVSLDCPGMDDYAALGFRSKLWKHQREAAGWLAPRGAGWLVLVERCGKTPAALAAAVAAGACRGLRTVVVTIGIAQRAWCREIERWTELPAWQLKGRAGQRLVRPAPALGDSVEVATRALQPLRCHVDRVGAKDWQPAYAVRASDGARLELGYCTAHPDQPVEVLPGPCPHCLAEVKTTLADAPFLVTNYELLIEQTEATEQGQLYTRPDLPGWVDAIREPGRPDIVIVDESHTALRTWRGKDEERSIQAALHKLCEGVPRVWLLTATPQDGYRRHYYPQLDLMTGGLWRDQTKRSRESSTGSLFSAEARYSDGHHIAVEHGSSGHAWWADGTSRDEEWVDRKAELIFSRTLTECRPDLPRCAFDCQEYETENELARKFEERGSAEARITRMYGRTLKTKLELGLPQVIARDVLGDEHGRKVIVLTKLKKSARQVAEALATLLTKPRGRKRKTFARQCGQIWLATGAESNDTRAEMCEAFSAHGGAGIFVATCDSIPGGVDLDCGSVALVHFAEIHESPLKMRQAARRPLATAQSLTIIYHVVRETFDDRMLDLVCPKFERLLHEESDESAGDARKALTREHTPETLDELLERAAAWSKGASPWEH